MAVRKHIDFSVPNWSELEYGPTLYRGLLGAMLADQPLGLWLAPGSGTHWEDLSGAGRHGTAENATAYNAAAVLGRREVVGLDFGSHANARVNCGVHAAINNTESFTLEAWARAKVTPASIVDIVGANYGSNPFGLGLRMVTAPLRLNLLTGGASALTSSGFTPPVGSWVHYAGTWNESSGEAAIYVNGTLHASGFLSKPRPKTSGQAFCIGNWTSTSRNWKGQIALAAVYGVALSFHDIALRYQLGVQGL